MTKFRLTSLRKAERLRESGTAVARSCHSLQLNPFHIYSCTKDRQTLFRAYRNMTIYISYGNNQDFRQAGIGEILS